VGFIPLRWQDASPESSSLASPKPSEGGSSIPRRKYLEQELLEVSAVGIPANPNALALGLKAGAVEKSDLKDLHELIRQTLGSSKDEWQPVPVKVKRTDEIAELVRLAKELRELLRA
jgi:hypothetical protein